MSVITPALTDVGAIIRTRTKEGMSGETGTFSENTRPTADEVTALIERAESKVLSAIGGDYPCEDATDLNDDAKYLVALQTALMVELSYFPEQIRSGQSPYPEYKTLYDEELQRTAEAIEERCGTETSGDADTTTSPGSPSFNFDTGLPPLPKDATL